jgi:hydroxyethylthiazole kinase-like uncharacterized protein yjeF
MHNPRKWAAGWEIVKEILSKRKKTSHKGDNGRVLVVGGSEEYVGAVALAGLAALRSGADLVRIAAPKKAAWAINTLSPDLITHKIDCEHFTLKNVPEIAELSKRHDVVLIGNGISLKSANFVKKLVKKLKKPLVIDADAIRAISMKDANNAIITPHTNELESLLKNSGKERILKTKDHKLLIKRLQGIIGNNVLLIKSRIDIILSKERFVLNHSGNEAMTKGGTGDVLAGLCAGFLAQSKDPMKSAAAAAWINGHIGDLLAKRKHGPIFLASDMVEEIRRII